MLIIGSCQLAAIVRTWIAAIHVGISTMDSNYPNTGQDLKMKIGITGGTGFVGRALIKQLATAGHELKCWRRADSNVQLLDEFSSSIEWVTGELAQPEATEQLVADCDAVVHSAFWRPGKGFRGTEGNILEFTRINILGTLGLIEAALRQNVERFVFVSTCAVHEQILDDRPLDETHPLWPLTHYGAHKAAIEKFVHSYGLGMGYPICAIRPTGIYGIHHPLEDSKWYPIVTDVIAGKSVTVEGGGKEVHVNDVAHAIEVLLNADVVSITGQAFACYDRYISRFEVAQMAKEISGSSSEIIGAPKTPKHQIVTDKIQQLGMQFGGETRLRETIEVMVAAISKPGS